MDTLANPNEFALLVVEYQDSIFERILPLLEEMQRCDLKVKQLKKFDVRLVGPSIALWEAIRKGAEQRLKEIMYMIEI